MKIYLFNPETGVYLGEDFADEAPMKQGGYIIPPDATTIAPPRIERGQILVFNSVEECWEVHTVEKWATICLRKSNNAIIGLATAFENAVRK
jgi:hypothetical protein